MKQIIYNKTLKIGKSYQLNQFDSHHLCNVLRLKKENQFNVLDKNNHIFKCKIVNINNNIIDFIPLIEIKNEENISFSINLYISIIKPKKLDMIFEKCTELGVSSFNIMETQNSSYSISIINEKKLDRWKRIIKSAIQQCGRKTIPKINLVNDIKNIKIPLNATVLLLDEHANVPMFQQLLNFHNNNDIYIFIGPEGSFTNTEKNQLVNKYNAVQVSVSNNILRSETAAIISVGICKNFSQYIEYRREYNENN